MKAEKVPKATGKVLDRRQRMGLFNTPVSYCRGTCAGLLEGPPARFKNPAGRRVAVSVLRITTKSDIGQPDRQAKLTVYGVSKAYVIMTASLKGDMLIIPEMQWTFFTIQDEEKNGFLCSWAVNLTAEQRGRWKSGSEGDFNAQKRVVKGEDADDLDEAGRKGMLW